MSDEQNLKLECLRLADGNVERAKAIYAWVTNGEPDNPPKSGVEKVLIDPAPQPLHPEIQGHTTQDDGHEGDGIALAESLEYEARKALGLFIQRPGARMWFGGKMPVKMGTPITVLYRDGESMRSLAGDYASANWHYSADVIDHPRERDIIAYVPADLSHSQASSGEAALHERFPAGKAGRDYESGLVDGATYLGERSEDRTPAYLDGLEAGRAVRDEEADPLADALLDDAVHSGLGQIDIETPADQVRTSDDEASTGDDRVEAVIDAEPPSIPRSEIPEGAAVETFTEQGVETVKLNGLTHIVEDEPEPFIDTTVAGSFSRGRERDAELMAEAEREPEQVEKPKPSFLGLFGAKRLVTQGAE